MIFQQRVFAVRPVVCVCLLIAGGCHSESRLSGLVPAQGTVFYKGTPVEGANIVFVPEGGGGDNAPRSASGSSDASGSFKLTTLQPGDGVFPGTYKILVSKIVPVTPITEEEKAASRSGRLAMKRHLVQMKNHLPQKYADPATCDFSVAIEKGGKKDIKLELVD